MVASYRRIDYRVRPAKNIERKMLAESFRRLSEFESTSAYRYVGMGSVYFSDFMLFHKQLGFESMVSIEDTTDPIVQLRFHLNVPFGHIEMKFGNSAAILQRLSWESRTVAWMDYDGALVASCLSDIDYMIRHAASGSILLLSLNAGNISSPSRDSDEGEVPDAVGLLKRAVGASAVPPEVANRDLSGWGVARVYRRIVNEAISQALLTRNATLPAGQKVKYRQLYNFHYTDGVKMLTLGGIIYDERDENVVDKCAFGQLDFVRGDEDAYVIDPPNLTYFEMRQIDALRRRPSVSLPLPPSDIERYERTYRYFPNFIEAEVG
jgi:hypothetical protein